jgi:hypothetical protein
VAFLPVQGDEEDVEDDGHLADEGQIVEVAEVGVHTRYYSFVMKGQSLLEVLNYAKKQFWQQQCSLAEFASRYAISTLTPDRWIQLLKELMPNFTMLQLLKKLIRKAKIYNNWRSFQRKIKKSIRQF